MRRALTFLLLVLLPAGAQWLETILALPDSFAGLVKPNCLEADSAAGLVYVGGEEGGGVTIIDGSTLERVGRLCPDAAVPAVLCVPEKDRVYCANYYGNRIDVYERSTRRHIGFVSVGIAPSALCYNPREQKIYCANSGRLGQDDSTVSIIDVGADTVLSTLVVGRGPGYLCYNPFGSRVYCACFSGRLAVIDGQTDSVVRRHSVEQPRGLCYNPVNQKMYCSTAEMPFSGIRVFDARTDTGGLLLPVRHDPGPICYNPANNRVYVAQQMGWGVIGFDGASNARVCSIAVPNNPSGLCYNPAGNKLYCSSRLSYAPTVTVIDCNSNSILATIPAHAEPGVLCHLPGINRVFCANWFGRSVTVVDGTTNRLLGHVGVGATPGAACYNPLMDRVYLADQERGTVMVIDAGSNRAVKDIPVGKTPLTLCHNSARNQIYCACYYAAPFATDSVAVIDCYADSVVRQIPVGRIEQTVPHFLGSALLYDPVHDQVFNADFGSDTLTVIDCATGTVRARVPVGDMPTALIKLPENDRVWCANYGSHSISVIDAATCQVVGTTLVPGSPLAFCYDSIGQKVYCVAGQLVAVLDAITAQVRTGVYIDGVFPVAVCLNPKEYKAYCVCYGTVPPETLLTVIDCHADTVVAQLSVGAALCATCYNPLNDKVYCLGEFSGTVSFVHGQTNQLIGWLACGTEPWCMVWSPTNNRTFIANHGSSDVAVVRDDMSGVGQESSVSRGRRQMAGMAVVRGSLYLPTTVSWQSGSVVLLDVSGRRVMELVPGTNDVSHLAPGVYFVRREGVRDEEPGICRLITLR